MDETIGNPTFWLLAVLFGIFIYFIPVLTAWRRGHRAVASIFVVNLFLAWSFVGWVVCLAWAYSPNVKPLEERGRVVKYLERKGNSGSNAGLRNTLIIGAVIALIAAAAVYLTETRVARQPAPI